MSLIDPGSRVEAPKFGFAQEQGVILTLAGKNGR